MRHSVFFLFCLLVLSGCAVSGPDSVAWRDSQVDLVWPQPPDPPRVRFLRTVNGENVAAGAQGTAGRLMQWLSGKEEVALPLVSPYGVAADGEGRIWVADPGSQAVHFFDLTRGQVDHWTSRGGQPFASPVGVAVDVARQRVYVADSVTGRVSLFDYSGKWLGDLQPSRAFRRPAGLAVDTQGNLYVVDVLPGVVDVFSPELRYLRSITGHDREEGGFNRPTAVAVAADGRVFVLDSMHFRVEVQDGAGTFLGYIGHLGDSPGTFARPRGIALDSAGHVYVADAAFDNIQIFDSAGTLLLYFAEAGKGDGQFCLPAGLAMDAQDRLYVVDPCNFRLQLFQYLASP